MFDFISLVCTLGIIRSKESKRTIRQQRQWTDAELVEAASHYKHKGDWKRSTNADHSAAYQAALNRPDVFTQATLHMTPKVHPYSHAYYIYAFEFSDRHVYVGLSFRSQRKTEHAVRGPVFDHKQLCAAYAYKELEVEIATPSQAQVAEAKWLDHYRKEGWTLLNSNRAGGLGTVRAVRWTKDAVLAEARKYSTKQAWIDGAQLSYRIAKREGWFDEASAHMPKRDARHLVGRAVSKATRAKQSAAKVGSTLTTEHREKIAASVKERWAARRS